jgi:hypothetical protein
MRLVPHAVALATVFAAGALAGCGGSVADADNRERARPTTPPSSPFCDAAQARSDAIRPLNRLVARGSAPPAELSSTVETVRRSGNHLLVVAPSDIRADVERSVQAVNLQLDALLASGGDVDALSRDPALNSPEAAAASERVTAYVNRNCGAGGTSAR